MYKKEEAKKIEQLVKEKEKFLYKTNFNYIENYQESIYLYSNDSVRKGHLYDMELNGWKYNEDCRNSEGFYSSFYDEDKVYILCGCFYKSINEDL